MECKQYQDVNATTDANVLIMLISPMKRSSNVQSKLLPKSNVNTKTHTSVQSSAQILISMTSPWEESDYHGNVHPRSMRCFWNVNCYICVNWEHAQLDVSWRLYFSWPVSLIGALFDHFALIGICNKTFLWTLTVRKLFFPFLYCTVPFPLGNRLTLQDMYCLFW